jgi:hypothetical protein
LGGVREGSDLVNSCCLEGLGKAMKNVSQDDSGNVSNIMAFLHGIGVDDFI